VRTSLGSARLPPPTTMGTRNSCSSSTSPASIACPARSAPPLHARLLDAGPGPRDVAPGWAAQNDVTSGPVRQLVLAAPAAPVPGPPRRHRMLRPRPGGPRSRPAHHHPLGLVRYPSRSNSYPGLSRCELAKGAVRPGCVVVKEIFGQYLAQVTLVNDQQPVEELTAQGADDPFADRVRSGRLRWAGENPDAFRREYSVEGAG
jgi:hypothetical protein